MQIHFKNLNYEFVIGFFFIVFLVMQTAVFAKPQSVKVALAQIFCLDGDRSGNYVRIENAIIEAKEQGAELVCFPETALLGWVNPEAHERAYPIPGKDSDRLCALAQKHNVYLSIGLAEKESDKLYDSVILIDNNGQLLLKHRKMNILSELMTPPYTPGEDVKAVDTSLGRIGLLICADSFRDDVLTRMKELKPDFLVIPYGWAFETDGWPEHAKELEKTVAMVALKVGAPVVGTDLVGEISHGPWTGQVYGGASVVADKTGKILVIGKDRDRDIIITTITF